MQRRSFLKTAAMGSLAWCAGPATDRLSAAAGVAASQGGSSEAGIEILPGEAIGVIRPDIYGHFVEHLGAVVYDGIWVGEQSKVPNIGGLRKALVEALRAVRPGVIRWPGGCFADSYNWRDGIGPRSQRPRRGSFWADDSAWPPGCPDGPWKYETNEFGTNEFVRFCRLVGAQPYFAANVRSLSPKDFYEWIDYCNAPAGATTLAASRAATGDRDPLGVRNWGVGNESWGCGGNFRPEEYAAEYRRFIEWVPRFGQNLTFIASGPNGGDLEWTRRFFAAMRERRSLGSVAGWALHHYSWNVSGGRTQDWSKGKGAAVGYPVSEWFELLNEANRMETLIADHWAAMGEADPQHRVKLVVDEWGAWYKPGSQVDPTHLFGQQSTMRDAVLAGLTLDTFNRHVDKVMMANVAQLVNTLHALFLAHEDQFLVTPTYHVFAMHQAHQGGRAVRSVFTAPPASYAENGRSVALPGLAGSASLHDRRLVLTVTNPDPQQAREAAITVRDAKPGGVRVTTLVAGSIQTVNTFDRPDAIRPVEKTLAATPGGRLTHTFPAASVTKLEMDLT
ncbi:MAG TPA: alpha-L-arabinofuranosidase C-terminal domain-containing protein [Vicinamibacterales bacterium]